MESKKQRRLHWGVVVFLLALVLGGGCDLQTKAWAEGALSGLPGRTISVLAPWLDLSLSYNRGTAFSMIGDLGTTRTVLGVLSLVLVVGLLVYVALARLGRFEALALGMIAGGAAGNGYDRLARVAPGGGTGVVDFIKVNYPWGGSWPTFNVADALLVVGIAVLFIYQIRARRPAPDGEQPAS